jgi:hypothetical protein
MRFLADENVERPIVEAVRALGHDVAYVSEMSRLAGHFVVLNESGARIRPLR